MWLSEISSIRDFGVYYFLRYFEFLTFRTQKRKKKI